MIIYSHRGIDLDRSEKLAENSLEAFSWAADHGFGVELDLQLNSQGEIIVAHDSTATRWSHGRCNLKWSDIPVAQLRTLESDCGKISKLKDVLQLSKEKSLHLAIHLKGANQTPQMLSVFVETLSSWRAIFPQILVFDCKLETAKLLREKFPTLDIAASVSTEGDLSTFNSLTSHTLYSLDQVLEMKTSFTWAWLDEWQPTLYNKDTFDRLSKGQLRSVVISPELHKAEKHPDAESPERLEVRWREILAFKPDAICTDFPNRIAQLLQGAN